MDYGKLDINAVCFGILCNFTPICGEKRAKEAVELVRSLQSENEKLRAELEQVRRERDAAIEDLSGQCEYCSRNDECINRKGPHWNCWEWRGSKED